MNFLVRAVDDVLKTEFGLPAGIADTSKIKIDWDSGQKDRKGKPVMVKKDIHRVQILDPAAGTGTFLAETVRQIADRVKPAGGAAWNAYVEEHLLPRLHGFELLMASYAMCHMKLDLMLAQLGYKPSATPPRLSVYLTNSLEPGEAADQTLPFAKWVSDEARGASTIKRDVPIMCIIGNPPYSGHSSNKGEWISRLMEKYKREPGGTAKLKEKNAKWLNDDYVKFIRMAEHMIAKTGEGVLAFITNHGYLDNPTFRGMRWHLMSSFDAIHVIDLHGNAKKKEVAPDGTADKNVFDIQQGVSLIFATRRKDHVKGSLAAVHHGETWGSRKSKYSALAAGSTASIATTVLPAQAPMHLFIPRDSALAAAYGKGFSVAELLPINSTGIVTARDALTIDMDRATLVERIAAFRNADPAWARRHFDLGPDTRDWQVILAQADLNEASSLEPVPIVYRPFDRRWTIFTGNNKGFHTNPRGPVMRELIFENIALAIPSQSKDGVGGFVIDAIANHKVFAAYDTNTIFPLYTYFKLKEGEFEKRLNMRRDILSDIILRAGLPALGQEIRIIDYIYGVLHSPAYRMTYGAFLKSDFPRIPYPASPEMFAHVSGKGEQLRRLHLMDPAAIGETPFPLDGDGDGTVTRIEHRADGRVMINDSQGFANVPELAWNFPIGGYLPAQKWLKDRKGRALNFADITHYQRIIKILLETDRIMKEIELPLD